jgi:hypothetical protein
MKLRHKLWREFPSINTWFLKAGFLRNVITPQVVAQIENPMVFGKNEITQQLVAQFD